VDKKESNTLLPSKKSEKEKGHRPLRCYHHHTIHRWKFKNVTFTFSPVRQEKKEGEGGSVRSVEKAWRVFQLVPAAYK